MEIHADHDVERSEVAGILASGIFNRAPNLVHILTYICSKYFDGSAEDIKEYNIAVEALGRPANFDQKRDSIVRVEAHRLRKRLREYYANEGADHVCQIEIPPGQYAPKFVIRQIAAPDPVPPQIVEPREPELQIIASPAELIVSPDDPVVPVRHAPKSWPAIAVLATGAVLAISLAAFSLVGRSPAHARNELVPPSGGSEIRILAGVVDQSAGNNKDAPGSNRTYVDASGQSWSGDRFFSGGSIFQSAANHRIAGTAEPRIYQSRREGTFGYDIPLAPGVYELRLYFAETLYGADNIAGGGETSRIFQVSANGHPLLRDFDVIADVGPSAADIKVFKDISPAEDGKLHLKFEPQSNPAFLNGIEIIPGVAGKMRPVRMVARDRGLSDNSGRFWDADRFVKGGQLVMRNEPVSSTSDPELYRGERFGNITYSIPVARPGRYLLTLHFVESWFGPGRPGGGGEGSRVFDILCDGVALRRNFDIFKEAGGANRALALSFPDLEPNPQGKLVISLIPSRNYAAINAIEIQDEAP